jgi:hypothetical protein
LTHQKDLLKPRPPTIESVSDLSEILISEGESRARWKIMFSERMKTKGMSSKVALPLAGFSRPDRIDLMAEPASESG